MRSMLMDEQAVSQDHDGDETEALGIARARTKDEIAELKRGQMLCGVLDGYRDPRSTYASGSSCSTSTGKASAS